MTPTKEDDKQPDNSQRPAEGSTGPEDGSGAGPSTAPDQPTEPPTTSPPTTPPPPTMVDQSTSTDSLVTKPIATVPKKSFGRSIPTIEPDRTTPVVPTTPTSEPERSMRSPLPSTPTSLQTATSPPFRTAPSSPIIEPETSMPSGLPSTPTIGRGTTTPTPSTTTGLPSTNMPSSMGHRATPSSSPFRGPLGSQAEDRLPYRTPSTNTTLSTGSTRSGYYGTIGNIMRQPAGAHHLRYTREESTRNEYERPSPTPSVTTLDREVRKYMRRRSSGAYQYYPGTERVQYDYLEERNDRYTTNLLESTAHLIKGSFGAGVLSMHEAYMMGGMWTSLIVTVVTGVLIGYTMYMLIRSAQKMYRRLRITKLSYPDLAEAAAATAPWNCINKHSKGIRYIVDVIIFLQMCGTCCIYQVVIAYTLKQMLEGFSSTDLVTSWKFDIKIYILFSAPLLVPLCLIRSLKLMAPFAMLADIFVAICVCTTLYYSLLAFNVSIDERPGWKDPHGLVRICGVCMYATSGICVALPVENNMRTPRFFPYAVLYATMVVIIFTAMTGVFGYWAWGEECRSPITVHMPLNTFTTILQFLLVMMLSTTFAVQFWVPFRIIWHYLTKKFKRNQGFWERLFRLLMAIIIMAVSLLFPNMIPVMIFLGQFFLGFIALIIPALIEFLVDREEDYNNVARVRLCGYTKNFVLVVIGILLSGSTIYSIKE